MPIEIVRNRFNRNKSILRQIFCRHKWVEKMNVTPECNLRCYYEQCEKCGKFKIIEYYKYR